MSSPVETLISAMDPAGRQMETRCGDDGAPNAYHAVYPPSITNAAPVT
jgi:hypothetical protein